MYKYFIALRYIRTRLITIFSIIGVAVGIMALFVTLSVMEGFKTEFESRLQGTLSDLIVTLRTSRKDYNELEKIIMQNPNVEACSPHLHGLVLVGYEGEFAGGVVYGIDIEKEFAAVKLKNYLVTTHKEERLVVKDILEENIKSELRVYSWKVLGGKPVTKDIYGVDGMWIACEKTEKTKKREEIMNIAYIVDAANKICIVESNPLVEEAPQLTESEQQKWQNYFNALGETLNSRKLEDHMAFYAPTLKRANGEEEPGGNCYFTCLNIEEPLLYPCEEDLRPVIIGYELQKKLGISYGSELALVTAKQDPVNNRLEPVTRKFVCVGAFRSGWHEIDERLCYARRGDLNNFFDWRGDVKEICISLKENSEAPEVVKQQLRKSLNPPSYELYGVERWQDRRVTLLAAIEIERSVITIILFFIILLAVSSIAIILTLLVSEKIKDIGILKALGASNEGVLGIFLFNGVFISFLGAIIGISMGLLICYNINSIADMIFETTGYRIFPKDIYYLDSLPVAISFFNIAIIIFPTLLLAFVVCFIPAIKAAMMDVVKALNSESTSLFKELWKFFRSIYKVTVGESTFHKATEKRLKHGFFGVHNVSKEYILGSQQLLVLDKTNLTVQQGEILAILGKSGAGKSTLLHVMGLLDSPTTGAVFHKGLELSDLPLSRQAKMRNEKIGFVFQFFHLLPEFTALENVLISAMIKYDVASWKQVRQEKITEAKNLLERVGLKERMKHRPIQLSGGERQRVAIARALMNKPEIVLCDEPTGNLDDKSSKMIQNLILELNEELQQTFIIITHDKQVAENAHRILLLEKGKLQNFHQEQEDHEGIKQNT